MPPRKKAETTEQTFPKSTTVKRDETVGVVAARLGITVERLREVNNLRHDNLAHGVTLHGE